MPATRSTGASSRPAATFPPRWPRARCRWACWLDRHHPAATRGVDLQLFWVLDNIGKSGALAARGSGIASTADLKGKRVATPFVSTSHFHLLVGLEQVWKIPPRDVRILNMQPPQIVAAWARRHRRGLCLAAGVDRDRQERQDHRRLRADRQSQRAHLRRPSGRPRLGREKPQVHGRLHRRDGQVLCRLPRQPGGLDADRAQVRHIVAS